MKKEDIAKICHEANRIYCISIGENNNKPWDETEKIIIDSIIKGVEYFLSLEVEPTGERMHNEWMRNKLIEGWRYGIIKDVSRKLHPCLMPYEYLSSDQKMKDTIFLSIVRIFKPLME